VGVSVKGLPVTVLSRGEVIKEEDELRGTPGRGQWLPMAAPARG
jgi:hypothetical protein